jgi:hypothetical protein
LNPFVVGEADVLFRINSDDSHQFWLNGALISTSSGTVRARLPAARCSPFRIDYVETYELAAISLEWTYISALIPSARFTGYTVVQSKYIRPMACTLTPVPLNGTGMCAAYFNEPSWQFSPSLTRIDPNIDFWWNAQGRPYRPPPFPARPFPDPTSRADGTNFSVRWTGCLLNPYLIGEARVSVSIRSDYGHSLYGNGTRLAISAGPTITSSEFVIPSRSCYPLRVDYYDSSATPSSFVTMMWTHLPNDIPAQFASFPVSVVVEQKYLRPTACDSPVLPVRSPLLNGTGLCGTYNPSADWSWIQSRSLKRVDPVLNFTWALTSPVDQVDRWTYVWIKYFPIQFRIAYDRITTLQRTLARLLVEPVLLRRSHS